MVIFHCYVSSPEGIPNCSDISNIRSVDISPTVDSISSYVARRSPAAAQCRGEAATVGGRRGALDVGFVRSLGKSSK